MVNAIENTDLLLLASTGLHLWEEQGWLFLPISRSLSTGKLSLSGNDSNSVSLKGRKIPMGLNGPSHFNFALRKFSSVHQK